VQHFQKNVEYLTQITQVIAYLEFYDAPLKLGQQLCMPTSFKEDHL